MPRQKQQTAWWHPLWASSTPRAPRGPAAKQWAPKSSLDPLLVRPKTTHSQARGPTCALVSSNFPLFGGFKHHLKLLRFGQPPPSTLTSLRPSNSTCLRTDLENSNIGSVNKSQAPSKHKPDGGLNEVAYSQPKATQKLPFPISRKTRGQPHCAPSKTRLASFSGGTLAGSTGE